MFAVFAQIRKCIHNYSTLMQLIGTAWIMLLSVLFYFTHAKCRNNVHTFLFIRHQKPKMLVDIIDHSCLLKFFYDHFCFSCAYTISNFSQYVQQCTYKAICVYNLTPFQFTSRQLKASIL